MTLFNQSTKALSAVIAEVADAVGTSGDAEMLARSLNSVNAAIQHFNTRANWEFLATEATPIGVYAPFDVGGVSASAGQTSANVPASHGIGVDDLISFPAGIEIGTRVSTTAATSIGLNTTIRTTIGTGVQVVTATLTRDLYSLPADWRMPYSVRLYSTPTTLRPLRRRFYDRAVGANEFSTVTPPMYYDIFLVGSKGKIRLLPPPGAADTMQLRYYRRMAVASATADATVLDIPQDYEGYLVAWAKWHFITDKGEGRSSQGQTWIAFAQEGIKTMLSDQTRVPDEDLGFVPGHYAYDPVRGPNSVRGIDWDR